MKLGDNMAPVEACSVWSDVCPLKSRPPKIGDIPRHVAVDDESPGCSSSKSALCRFGEEKASKSSIDGSSIRQRIQERSKLSEALPVIRDFFQSTVSSKSLVRALQNPEKIAAKFNERTKNYRRATREKISRDEADGESEVTAPSSEGRSLEDDVPIFQIRKDSALYIEERNVEASKLGCSAAAVQAEICDKTELGDPSELTKRRTRRESSGYFSNFGTFDEDRWTASAMDAAGNQQNVIPTARRRSSTKNRLPMTFNQQQQLSCGQQSTKIEQPSSTPDSSDHSKSVMKSSNAEMPDIAEQASLEMEKPTNGKSSVSDETFENIADKIDDLTNDLSEISLENSSANCLDASIGRRFDDKNGGSTASSRGSSSKEAIFERDEKARPLEMEIEISNVDDDDDVVAANSEWNRDEVIETRLLPRPIKVYQLLSTQSEDRNDDETRLYDRRTSLEITRRNRDEASSDAHDEFTQTEQRRTNACSVDEKKLVHADSVPILKIRSSASSAGAEMKSADGAKMAGASESSRASLCMDERLNLVDKTTTADSTIAGIRPIYPYCPYSPYASPQGSPRTNRRRPLRESRRVSIDSRQGALQLNQYKLLNNIGQGSYGIVKLAYNEEEDVHYAMKILSKRKLMKKAGIFGRMAPGRKGSANPLAKVYREIALLKKLDHPNVVKLVEVLDDPDEDNLYLVFELVQRGEVLQVPTDKPLDEETARKCFRDVVMGVEYLHYQRIVHRDIKPSNLLVDSEGRVKVADLGVSAELRASGELLSGLAGTPAFAAPETTTLGAQYSGTLCDIWSMGVTLYSLVIGKVPWDGAGSIIGVQAAIRSEQLRFPETPRISESLNDLVSRMLAKDPARRANLGEIKEHRWLTNNGSEPLPSETENCRTPVTVTDEEVARVVTRVPKLDTLILIKTMLKQHSFQNPFLPRRFAKVIGEGTSGAASSQRASIGVGDSPNDDAPKTKTEQFQKAGRSNSAPDSYDWRVNERQMTSDSLLPPVTESSCQEGEIERR